MLFKSKFLLLAILFCAASCQQPGIQQADGVVAAADSAANSTIADAAVVNASDPDPLDTIPAGAYGINTYRKEAVITVTNKLQQLYKNDLANNLVDSFSRRFILFEYDLDNNGSNEIFTGFTGPFFCGSGGCTILLLAANGDIITTFTVTDYPVVIASSTTNGWKDLYLESRGKFHLATFNGKTYPSNPTLLPLVKQLPGDGLARALNWLAEPYPWFKF
jgi:hypothetical protein